MHYFLKNDIPLMLNSQKKIILFFYFNKVYIFILLFFLCIKGATPDILKAKEYLEFGDYEKGLKEIEKSINEDEFNVEAQRLYQDVMIELDEFPSLIKEYEKKVEKFPKNYLFNYLYGRLLIYSSDLEKAKKFFHIAIELNPKFPWSYDALARRALYDNDFLKAKEISEKCINICGDFIPSYLTIISCCKNLYRPEKTIHLLEDLIHKFPSEIDLILKLVNFYNSVNKSEKAEILIKENIEKYKNDYKYHRLVYELANCISSVKLRKKLFHSYWKNYPHSPLITSVYKKLYEIYKSEDFNKALKYAREAINYKTKIKKLKSLAYKNLIEFYKHKEKNEKLIQVGYEIINSDLANPNILNELGELLLDKGEVDIAILLFEKAVNSCKWENLKNNVYFGPLINEKDKDNTIKIFLNASNYYLGKAYFVKEEFNKAIDYLKKVIDEDNMIMEGTLMYIANCYISLNNESEAKKILTKAYIEFGSKKALELLKKISKEKNENLDNFPCAKIDNVRDIKYFSNYKGRILVLGLHSSTCEPCLKFLKILIKLENEFSERGDVVFINLFEENKNHLVLDSMTVNRPLFREIKDRLNIWRLPQILIIDREGNINYRIIGFEEEGENYQDLEFKIELSLKGKVEHD